MVKKLYSLVIGISLVIGLVGCSSNNMEYPGEEKIQKYVQAAIGLVSDENDELSQAIIELFKTKLFKEIAELDKEALSDDGVEINTDCTTGLQISTLSSICGGTARLYIDDKLSREYKPEDGSPHLGLSMDLTDLITRSVVSPTYFEGSVKGKRLYMKYYIPKSDWNNVIKDKDPYKYMCIDVIIK